MEKLRQLIGKLIEEINVEVVTTGVIPVVKMNRAIILVALLLVKESKGNYTTTKGIAYRLNRTTQGYLSRNTIDVMDKIHSFKEAKPIQKYINSQLWNIMNTPSKDGKQIVFIITKDGVTYWRKYVAVNKMATQ